MKKILAFLLSVIIIFSCFTISAVAATPIRETENNDTVAKANQFSGKIVGSLSSGDDIDYYKFNTSGNYFIVDFGIEGSPLDVNVGDGWGVAVYDGSMNLIWTSEPIYEKATSINLAFTGTIYVKVYAHYKYFTDGKPIDIDYGVKVTQNVGPTWEKEANNELKKANIAACGKSYTGNLYNEDDVDYYKFNVTKDYFILDFGTNNNFIGSYLGDGFALEVYDKSMDLLWSGTCYSKITSPIIAVNGTIYVKVCAQYKFFTDGKPVGIDYDLKLTQKSDSKWETETNNNVLKVADSIKAGISRKGTLLNGDDADNYKLTVLAAGTVKLSFSRSLSDDDGVGYKIELKNSAGSVLETLVVDNITKGSLSGIVVSKGTYYITVSANKSFFSSNAPTSDIIYNVAYSFKLATPSLKKAVSENNTVKVTWNKKSYVDGYQLQYATNKSFSKAKTVTFKGNKTVSNTLKKLTVGKKYYVRIRTFKKIDGKTNYSSWSKVKTATTYKLEKPTLSKVSASKKALKVTWKKKSKIDGYQIEYSTSKTFKKAKTVSVSKSKTSTTIKKLSAKKKYYVRIRTYKKLDGVKKYSSWSKVLNKKTK